MIRIFAGLLLGCLFFGSAAFAETEPVKKDKESEAALKAKTRKLAAESRKDLNGTQWEVTVSSQDPKAKGTGKDILTFQNNQVTSRNLSKRGFSPTNYTITPLDEGERAMWESMQTGGEGIVFLRGEWKEGVMTGTLTEQLEDGKVTLDYYFTSAARKEVPENSAEEKEAKATSKMQAAEPPKALTSSESAPEPTTTTSKKAKKKLSY